MRRGHSSRADAILNSPVVRAFLRPITTLVTPLPYSPPTALELISTQPPPSLPSPAPVAGPSKLPLTSALVSAPIQNYKRGRDEEDEGRKEVERDAKDVVVSYTEDNLPPELTKYWNQRYRLFSRFDEGCQMDLEGWYSVTPEAIAVQIAERCRSSVIVDAFCGVGGNAIQFAFTCEKVIAIDLDPVRLACAAHNAALYGVADRITFVLADFTEWSRDYARRQTAGEIPTEDQVEVVFLSPPWGGIDYQQAGTDISDSPVASSLAARKSAGSTKEGKGKKSTPAPSYPLSALAPLPGDQLFSLARLITPHVAYYLPRNVDIDELGSLPAVSPRTDRAASEGPERVEIEEEWMGGRMKAVTAYYGDLATAAADRIESTA